MGLANRLVEPGRALPASLELAHQLAKFPQICLRGDRMSSYQQWNLDQVEALKLETEIGLETIKSGETGRGARRFAEGAGRHGEFE